jgi:hypothetical protein
MGRALCNGRKTVWITNSLQVLAGSWEGIGLDIMEDQLILINANKVIICVVG